MAVAVKLVTILISLALCWRAQKQRLIDGVAKFKRGLNAAPEKGNDDKVRNDLAILQKVSIRRESDVHNAVVISKVWNAIEKNNWGVRTVANRDFLRRQLVGPVGCICHLPLPKV
jgi:hypothetical protein